jgi:outer membrane protein TolC
MKRFQILSNWSADFRPVPGRLWTLAIFLMFCARSTVAQQPTAQPATSGAGPALTISLQNALERARSNNQQLQSALLNTALVREDRIQSKAGLLPTLSYNNQYIYTQGNGTPSGVFVANDGVHIYNSQATIHEEVLSMARVVEYRRAVMAQAIAEAKAEVLARGLAAAVVQDYYALVIAQRRFANAQQSLQEAQTFVDVTQKLEKGGEVARADVIKAQIVLQQRRRDVQDAQLAIEKARISLAVLIFPDLNLNFTVADDLKIPEPLAPFDEFRALAVERSPDLRAAQVSLKQETLGIKAARSAYLPTLSFDYWYGINANEFAVWSGERKNLGYSAQASLNFPLWNWGITKSKVRQAEFRQRQAQLDLSLTQKQLLSDLNSSYAEARTALAQLDSLSNSLNLASESLRLTVLRYQAGEVSVLEVVDAQSTLTQARNAYDDGLSRYRVALANLQTLTGTL